MFELLTGYCLFDYTRYWIEGDDYSSASSYSSSEYNEEEDDEKYPVELTLLAMMRRVLGGFESKLFKKGKYYDLFFNYKGRLKHYPNYLQEESLESIICECNYDDDTTNEICVFLRKMLCINPNLRSTTNELLKDNFLKPIKEI
jgi:serine/threonine protein kinase